MKLITRDTDYAVRALCYIATGRNKITPASELVRGLKIPRPFLRKILQTLNRRRLLISYKGQGGGFKLGRPANKIFLLELMEIFQGRFKLNECLFKKRLCPNLKTCILSRRITQIEKYVCRELDAITLAHLIGKGRS